MTSSGILKLGDFGVSKVLRSTVELAYTQIGTPYYMSPEIMQVCVSWKKKWNLMCMVYDVYCMVHDVWRMVY
ncbi:hypothetical protein EON63_20865 [archaeon]|nr:MAG: hypothetical protein EON63_20865 [archaeon]